MHNYSIDTAIVFRQRALHAETEARKATNDTDREVFMFVAETWREIALAAARAHKAGRQRPHLNRRRLTTGS